jgi:ferredoxin
VTLDITANRETCRGYANRVRAAPAVFDTDDDGKVAQSVPNEAKPGVQKAVYDGPSESLAYTES